jgi:hypothetical protein
MTLSRLDSVSSPVECWHARTCHYPLRKKVQHDTKGSLIRLSVPLMIRVPKLNEIHELRIILHLQLQIGRRAAADAPRHARRRTSSRRRIPPRAHRLLASCPTECAGGTSLVARQCL